jgi:Ca2+-binding RTX toxin-like protein
MGGDNVIFGHGGDDLIVGGYCHDWISGGTGDDGILGDDGVITISRDSSAYGEPLYGIDLIAAGELTAELAAPGPAFHDIINVENELTHTARLFAFTFEIGGNDMAYGGLGADSIHGGAGDDALSGAEALPGYFSGRLNELLKATQGDGNTAAEAWFFDIAPFNPGDILQFQQGDSAWFRLFNQLDPLRMMLVDVDGNRVDDADVSVAYADPSGTQTDIGNVDYDETIWLRAGTSEQVFDFFLNFDPNEGVLDTRYATTAAQVSDGDDVIFGDLGNDWIVGGTGRDHEWGGAGEDVLNADDNHLTTIFEQDPIANDAADPFQAYSDIAFGGKGRDVLLGNTGADRLIDWIGEYNSYSVPFNPFGGHQISRQNSPGLKEFLYELARADGADLLVGVERGGTADRNGEPFGETGLTTPEDAEWAAQHGAPLAQQPGSYPGRRVLLLRELEAGAGSLAAGGDTTTGGDTTSGGDTTPGGDTTSGGDATTGGDAATGGDTPGNGNGGNNGNAGGNGKK